MANHIKNEIESLQIKVDQLEKIKKQKERQLVRSLYQINLTEDLVNLMNEDKRNQQQQQKGIMGNASDDKLFHGFNHKNRDKSRKIIQPG